MYLAEAGRMMRQKQQLQVYSFLIRLQVLGKMHLHIIIYKV